METDETLISNIKKNFKKNESFKQIVERHEKLYYKIISQYTKGISKEFYLQMCSDKEYYIFEYLKDYDESKQSKFSTYLSNRLKWKLIKDYHNNKKVQFLPINEEITNTKCPECKNDLLLLVKDFLLNQKDERVYKIFELRYFSGLGDKLTPWHEIAKEIRLSSQGCIDIHNKFIKKLKKEERKKNGVLFKPVSLHR